MLKYNDKSIGNLNLISTFLILMFMAFIVIMLSVNYKLDDFVKLEAEIKKKFLEDKKNDIRYKINNINELINFQDKQDIVQNKKLIHDFIKRTNDKKYRIITVQELSTDMPYYDELIEHGEYYKHTSVMDKETEKKISTIEYLVLNKKWNWVISTKFNDNIINEEIQTWEQHLLHLIRDNIYVHISLLFLFSIALLLVMYIIHRIANRTIKKFQINMKRKEEKLKEEIHTLQRLLNNETDKYDEQSKMMQKQSKMLALGDMLSNLSRQWRRPLTEISETVQSIKLSVKEDMLITDKDIEKLTYINNSAVYLSRTVDDFRVFLKADSLKIDFIVSEIVEKALVINRTILKKNNIKIVKDLDKDVMIHNLSFGLLQAMVNIIYNAKDALKKIDEQDRYIFISTKNSEESVEIKITDTGKGIPEDVKEDIFKPYFTTKQKTYGTGLGLHMAHNIIEQNMSGKIFVSNEETTYNDKTYIGASFSIILYLNDKEEGQ
ncbi:MAG: HAMP domain-containing sensor histidine kinase [Arcobacteraceae bacterium]